MKRNVLIIILILSVAHVYAEGNCKDFVLHYQDGIEYKLYQPCVKFRAGKKDSAGYRCTMSRIDTLYFIRKKVKELVIPESIVVDSITYPVTICAGTRSVNCFKSVVLPKHVRGADFRDCYQIEKIDMSQCNMRYCERLNDCANLKTLVLPDRLKSLDNNEISECKSLEKIVLPDSTTFITLTFTGCENLREIYISKGLYKIETAFQSNMGEERRMGDVRFRKIKVDKKNPYYCSVRNVLYNKDKTELILYPARKRNRVFVVPKTVKKIGMYAFHNATNLKKVVLSNSVRHIGRGAFEGCTSLDSIQFPTGILYIDKESMPKNIKDLYFRGDVSFDRNNPSSILHLPDGSVVSSKDYFITKPISRDTELLTCDSIAQSVKNITNVPFNLQYSGWGVGGDHTAWNIIKCGKEAVPCLISMLEDSSRVTVVYERSFPFSEMRKYEVSVARVAYSLLVQIIPEIESDGMYERIDKGLLKEIHDYVATWYDSHKDHLVWVHSLEPQWRIDNKYIVVPSEGHYEIFER